MENHDKMIKIIDKYVEPIMGSLKEEGLLDTEILPVFIDRLKDTLEFQILTNNSTHI